MTTLSSPTTSRTPPKSWAPLVCYCLAVAAWVTLVLVETRADLPLIGKVFLVTLGLLMPLAGILTDPICRAVSLRELLTYFYTPVGYVVLAVFTALSGLFFISGPLRPGTPIDTGWLYDQMVLWVLIPLTPAISMRLFAEEQRSGNLEALVTAPLTDAQLVLGKWIGALGFLAVTLTVSFLMVLLLEVFGNPDYGPIFTGYLGMVLIGGLLLAVGVFTSVLTHNQIIAFLVSLALAALFTYVNLILTNYYASGRWAAALKFINPFEHFRNFSLGILDTGDFVFLLSATAMFLVLAVKALETRKWR